MIITDDLLDAAETAYVDAIDLGVTNKHIATKILEVVIPLIAAAEREACAQIAWDHAPSLIDCEAMKIHDAIVARGASCA